MGSSDDRNRPPAITRTEMRWAMNAAVSSLACVLIGLVIIGVADDVSAWVWPALVSHMVGCAFSYVAAVPRALYAKPRLHVRFMMAGFYLFVIGTVCLVSVVATL